jgi:hypothetical protein
VTMMSFNVFCDPTEVWILQKVLTHYHVYAAVWPTDPPGPQVRLLVHANTTAQGHRMQAVLEGAQAALTALHFMGYVRVAEGAPTPEPCTRARARRAYVDGS